MMILIWLLIGFGIYYLVKDNNNEERKSNSKADAVEMLKLRYVNGEIDQQTYLRTLEVLKD